MWSLTYQFTPPPENLVKEFYSNIFNISSSSFSIYIRGNIININHLSLAEYLGIPHVERPIYLYNVNNCPPMTVVASLMVKRTIRIFKHKEFPSSLFAPENIIASRIIFTNICPNKHLSSISFKMMRLLYAFLSSDSIDLASNIYKRMLKIFKSNSSTLKLYYG